MKRSYNFYTKRFENKANMLAFIEQGGIHKPHTDSTGISRHGIGATRDGGIHKCHYRVTLTIEEVRPVYDDGVFVGEELT